MMNVQMFTNALNQFHRLYPNVTYEVIEGGGKIVENLTSNDDVDIGITTLPVITVNFIQLLCITRNYY